MRKVISMAAAVLLLISMLSMGVVAQADSQQDYPHLAEGNHEKWIDRLADLPDFAMDFYTWLEDNATAEGMLADPAKGDYLGGNYVYTVASISRSVPFTYTSSQDMKACAKAAVDADLGSVYAPAIAYIKDVYNLFNLDHPEVYWLNGSSLYSYSYRYSYGGADQAGTATYTMNIFFILQSEQWDHDVRAEGYRSTELIAQAIARRDAAVERILSYCTQPTPAEQIRYLSMYLVGANAYNSSVGAGDHATALDDAWRCISALEGNVGPGAPVCEGYSRAFKVLCDRLGIPCVLVEGGARGDVNEAYEAHMWNYVQLDGSWYAVDVTWNDPYVKNNPLEKISGFENESWMLLGGKSTVPGGMTFLQSHVEQNNATSDGLQLTNGPVLSDSAYVAHSYDATVTTPATCDQDGLRTYICSGCGDSYTEVIPATGHSYESQVTEPTCTQAGYTTHTCANCQDSYTDAHQDALGHRYTDGVCVCGEKERLRGDVTGDGKVNMKDWSALYDHVNEVKILTGEDLEYADVNGDGKVNMKDWSRLYEHVNEINPLW